jgi:hypothetical protein
MGGLAASGEQLMFFPQAGVRKAGFPTGAEIK